MSQCNYCDRTYDTDEALVEHMYQVHDREELSPVDRRWVERYAEATGEPQAEGDPSSEGSEDGTFDRRQVMALAGASSLGIAGMTVGLAEQNGLSVGDLPGLGTQNNPIQISTFSELLTIDNNLTADHVLVDDIDASNESPITPLGSVSPYDPFTGTLDGQGHTIEGLEIDSEGSYESAGLFHAIDTGATIESLNLVDVTVTGEKDVGGLVAIQFDGTIRDCWVSGQVESLALGGSSSPQNVGGIAGQHWNGTIESCATNVTINSNGPDTGGLVGENQAMVSDSYAIGDVQAGGEDQVGGITGRNNTGTTTKTYAAGSVDGSNQVGGVVGYNESGTVSDSYWDKLATNQNSGVGTNDDTVTNVVGFDTNDSTGRANEMTGADATNNMTAFDFGGTWETVEGGNVVDGFVAQEDGYPVLSSVDTAAQLDAQGLQFREVVNAATIEGDNVTLSNVTVGGDGN